MEYFSLPTPLLFPPSACSLSPPWALSPCLPIPLPHPSIVPFLNSPFLCLSSFCMTQTILTAIDAQKHLIIEKTSELKLQISNLNQFLHGSLAHEEVVVCFSYCTLVAVSAQYYSVLLLFPLFLCVMLHACWLYHQLIRLFNNCMNILSLLCCTYKWHFPSIAPQWHMKYLSYACFEWLPTSL